MNRPPLSALIVDDEPIARQRIRRLLAREPDFRLVGDFGSVAECEALDASAAPDLVLLDVRMPENRSRYSSAGTATLARQALRDVEARLDANHFVRVHRSTIITSSRSSNCTGCFTATARYC